MFMGSLVKILETSPMLLYHLNTVKGSDPIQGSTIQCTCSSTRCCFSYGDMDENDGLGVDEDGSELVYGDADFSIEALWQEYPLFSGISSFPLQTTANFRPNFEDFSSLDFSSSGSIFCFSLWGGC